jgi:hypothetical protein
MSEYATGRGESIDRYARSRAYDLTRAALSAADDPAAGAHAARAIAASVLAEAGVDGLAAVTVDLSLTLASALERIGSEQGTAAIDLAEVWLME